MKKILISIKPTYVEKILNGTKKYEFRTKAAKQDVNGLVIYSTFPEKKIVAEVEIIDVIEMKPEELWELTNLYAGISKEDYDDYFNGRKVAYAYKLGKVVQFNESRNLEYYGIKFAPQSFIYLDSL